VISSSVRFIAIDQLAKLRIKYTSPCWSRSFRPAIDDGQRALELTGSVGAVAPVAVDGAGALVAVDGADGAALVAVDGAGGAALVAADDTDGATLWVLSGMLHAVNAAATNATPAAASRSRRRCRSNSSTTGPTSHAIVSMPSPVARSRLLGIRTSMRAYPSTPT
jgi:hypothetical protein